MLFTTLRLVHILCGIVALLVGTAAILAPKRRGPHTIFGKVYVVFIALLCVTALAMSAMNLEQSAYLIPIAFISFGFAWSGERAMKLRGPDCLRCHIRGMLGSYIAIWTAVLVVSGSKLPVISTWPSWLYWILPTVIGSPAIRLIQHKLAPRAVTSR
jgi:uncharacterized membrane protein